MTPTEVAALRLDLVARGYLPIPLYGKIPPLKNWQTLDRVDRAQVEMWGKTWPDARNTGVLTRDTPTLDLDLLSADAVRAIIDYLHEQYDERGYVDVRVGLAPKAAVLFRTVKPFGKIVANVIAPNGKAEKVELLGDGQQVVAYGTHPETKRAYAWHGSEPLQHEQQELPHISEEEAHALVGYIVDKILVPDFGYTRAKERPGKRQTRENGGTTGGGAEDWSALVANIQNGQELHDSLCALSSKMIKSGMSAGAAVNMLRGFMDAAGCPHDDRWASRRNEIPRIVDSAAGKYAAAGEAAATAPRGGAPAYSDYGADDPPDFRRVTDQPASVKRPVPLESQAAFLAAFTKPTYIVDGVLQRGFIYSLTGKTGHAKTAIALVLMRAIGCEDPHAKFGGHSVEKGRVLYLVGENGDDIRARVIAANALRGDQPDRDQIFYIPGVFPVEHLFERIEQEAKSLGGGFDLIIIDTSAAYFPGDEENNNAQAGAYARSLRTLTNVSGKPCVVALCHPIKHAADPSQLLPRGGGAYLNEVDGNLTCWRHDDALIELHHSADKFRDPGFEPITFRLEKITTPALVDTKGRKMPTVRAVAISETEQAEETRRIRSDEDRLLVELLISPDRSYSDLARACEFFFDTGEPAKSRLQRTMKRLETSSPKLVAPNRNHWILTDAGRKLAKQLKDDEVEEIVEDRAGAITSKPFAPRIGKPAKPTVPCAHCGKTGDVHRIADDRLPKGKAHAEALHLACAEAWFTGQID